MTTKAKKKSATPKVIEGVVTGKAVKALLTAADAVTEASTQMTVASKQVAVAVPAKPDAGLTKLQRRMFTPEQITMITDTVARGLTPVELGWFLEFSKEVGLSPLRKQIYAIKRWSNAEQREVMTIQVGIDGLRATADRTGNYAPSDRMPKIDYDEKGRLFAVTFWVKKFVPKDKSWHEYSATCLWDEFVPLKKDGELPAMWKDKPHNQLEKCAEAKALRRGFPEALGQMYVSEEIERTMPAEPPTGDSKTVTHETLQAAKRERERGTLEPGKEANRGHGDEGFVDEGPKPGKRAVSPNQKKVENKEDAKRAKLERLATKVETVEPRLKSLTKQQENDNNKARAKKEPPKHEKQPYFIAHCAGGLHVYGWSSHVFKAMTASQGKDVIWMVERRTTNDSPPKEFLSLVEVVSQNGTQFVQDAASKDWIPVAQVKTEAPSVPDKGESVPRGEVMTPDEEAEFLNTESRPESNGGTLWD